MGSTRDLKNMLSIILAFLIVFEVYSLIRGLWSVCEPGQHCKL